MERRKFMRRETGRGKRKRRRALLLAALLALSLLLCGCAAKTDDMESDGNAPALPGLVYEETEPCEYAECFTIFRYRGGYCLLAMDDGQRYLIVPEKKEAPEDLPEDIKVLLRPLENVYLASTSTASLLDAAGALEHIAFCSLEADEWSVDGMKEAMERGRVSYAGKYSQPDYERLVENGCTLALENTMILHKPEVAEKLEALGIPVFIDRSSYEDHPLGRCEWIKVYGELFDCREQALSCFEEQKAQVEAIAAQESGNKTVAFFYVNESGGVVVRKSDDYVPKMIELAGGVYIFDDLKKASETASSSVNMTLEEFYAVARDADVLVYNGGISRAPESIEELLEKNALFADFRAVKEDRVFCTDRDMYQAAAQAGRMIADLHTMLTDEDAETLGTLYRIH